jgi:hypothetical protein
MKHEKAGRLGKCIENCLYNQPTTGLPLIANTEVHCNDTTLNDIHVRRHVGHKHVTSGMCNGKEILLSIKTLWGWHHTREETATSSGSDAIASPIRACQYSQCDNIGTDTTGPPWAWVYLEVISTSLEIAEPESVSCDNHMFPLKRPIPNVREIGLEHRHILTLFGTAQGYRRPSGAVVGRTSNQKATNPPGQWCNISNSLSSFSSQ